MAIIETFYLAGWDKRFGYKRTKLCYGFGETLVAVIPDSDSTIMYLDIAYAMNSAKAIREILGKKRIKMDREELNKYEEIINRFLSKPPIALVADYINALRDYELLLIKAIQNRIRNEPEDQLLWKWAFDELQNINVKPGDRSDVKIFRILNEVPCIILQLLGNKY